MPFRKFLLPALAVLTISTISLSHAADRSDDWKKVRDAVENKQAKTAVELLKPLEAAAFADQAWGEGAKALIMRVRIENRLGFPEAVFEGGGKVDDTREPGGDPFAAGNKSGRARCKRESSARRSGEKEPSARRRSRCSLFVLHDAGALGFLRGEPIYESERRTSCPCADRCRQPSPEVDFSRTCPGRQEKERCYEARFLSLLRPRNRYSLSSQATP